ncbi:hypothetical protein JXL21_05095 [Candidatus Bathyarchaeota archaeon]|nr:hypothetical protein [Candidatus Bathyarchaeota archaeon]
MPTVYIELTEKEYRDYLSKKGDKTHRDILLDAVGVDSKPRRVGRPPRTSLDMLGRPGSIPTTDGSEGRKLFQEVYGTWKKEK